MSNPADNTKKIFIASEPLDYHAQAVRWAASELSFPVTYWERNLFPAEDVNTFAVSGDSSIQTLLSTNSINASEICAIWNRRGRVSKINESLHKTDKIVARNESKYFLNGVLESLEYQAQEALVVNPQRSVESANCKILQLQVASAVGFNIPQTRVTNDPDQVRNFYNHCDGNLISKMHFPYSWRTEDGTPLTLGTVLVTEGTLSDEDAIKACPMIYQEKLDIRSEIRVTIFGKCVFAIQQSRQKISAGGFHDIRLENPEATEFELPEDITSKCFDLLDQLGLRYGAIDIAITEDGDFRFLEVNESGQFLFLEQRVPSIPILQAFTEFLASGNPSFCFNRSDKRLSLMDFDQSDAGKSVLNEIEEVQRKSKKVGPFELQE